MRAKESEKRIDHIRKITWQLRQEKGRKQRRRKGGNDTLPTAARDESEAERETTETTEKGNTTNTTMENYLRDFCRIPKAWAQQQQERRKK